MKVTLGTFHAAPDMRKHVNHVLDTGRLSYGPYSILLEKEMASITSHKYGVLSNSGTSSLVVALLAMKEKYGWTSYDEIIIPAITFVASFNAIVHAGLTPRIVDVDPDRWDFGYDAVANAYNRHTKAVMAVNLFGKPSQLRGLKKACKDFGLKLIEDSCEAIGALHHKEPVGSFGDISVFSFYMAHIITAGVGGCAVTSDEELALLMRSYVNHGLRTDSIRPEEYDAGFLGRDFIFDRIGHSYRITELEAAIAFSELGRLLWILKRRNEVAAMYNDALSDVIDREIQVASVGDWETSSWMMYPFVIKNAYKHEMKRFLRSKDIECRDMLPLVNQPCYLFDIDLRDNWPVAQRINEHGLYVGCHENITEDQVGYVADAIKEALSK